MKSIYLICLALTVTVTAVEEKSQTKKRGLEETVLKYAQQNHALPLGGPFDLGNLKGLELKSFGALRHEPSSHVLPLTSGSLHGIPLSLGHHIPQISLQNFLVGNDNNLHSELLFGNTHSLGGFEHIAPLPLKVAAPISIPQSIIPIPAAPGPGKTQVASVSISLPAPAAPPAPSAQPAPLPAKPQGVGTLGSGSLGYANLGNGVIAIGSGSLGYAPPQTVQSAPPQPAPQNIQLNFGQHGGNVLQSAISVPFTVPVGYGGHGTAFDSGYGGLSLNGNRLSGGQASGLGANLISFSQIYGNGGGFGADFSKGY